MTKDTSCFLRLDMRPEGYDLKAYVTERCEKLNSENDFKTSTTAYIQQLIIADMKRKQKRISKKDKLKDAVCYMIDNMTDTEVSALAVLLKKVKGKGLKD